MPYAAKISLSDVNPTLHFLLFAPYPGKLFSYFLKFLFYVPRLYKSGVGTQRGRVWSFHCF
jgi:hypothetical protein